jgi:hypothetical protein
MMARGPSGVTWWARRLKRAAEAQSASRRIEVSDGKTLRPSEYRRRQEQLGGWKVGIISYRLGEQYHCDVDNVSPGTRLARGEGKTREEAERQALDKARDLLSRTRTFPVD